MVWVSPACWYSVQLAAPHGAIMWHCSSCHSSGSRQIRARRLHVTAMQWHATADVAGGPFLPCLHCDVSCNRAAGCLCWHIWSLHHIIPSAARIPCHSFAWFSGSAWVPRTAINALIN
ncbi:hypothetical protein COO60DRAFT_439633 [Scenedesmus sp. NREL 46B-D3]|nr:hypothetical protein COO60DRAFT_439633 [Scenedesmus sp. NREL 46B-D3]